jgi:hypothetical protein
MDALSHDIPAAVAAFREAGERWGLAFSLMGLADMRTMLGSATGHLAVATGDLPNAQRYLEEALVLAVEMPDMPVAAIVGVGVARLCRYHGAAHEAAEVLGAAHALRGAPDRFNPDVAELAAELRRRLGERAYQAAYDRGSGSSRTGALALISDQVRRW